MYVFDKYFGGIDIGKISIGDDVCYVMLHDSEADENNEYFDGKTYNIAAHGDVIIWNINGKHSVVFHCDDNGTRVEKVINGKKVSVASFDKFVEINVC